MSVYAYMEEQEHIDFLSLETIQAYLSLFNPQYLNHYIDNTVDTLLEAFHYLTITFSRRLRGEIRCEAVTYWGEIYKATGSTHLLIKFVHVVTMQDGFLL